MVGSAHHPAVWPMVQRCRERGRTGSGWRWGESRRATWDRAVGRTCSGASISTASRPRDPTRAARRLPGHRGHPLPAGALCARRLSPIGARFSRGARGRRRRSAVARGSAVARFASYVPTAAEPKRRARPGARSKEGLIRRIPTIRPTASTRPAGGRQRAARVGPAAVRSELPRRTGGGEGWCVAVDRREPQPGTRRFINRGGDLAGRGSRRKDGRSRQCPGRRVGEGGK